MALRDFWMNVRSAARLIAPGTTADSPRLDAGDMEKILREAVFWFTPKTVKGFDSQDFEFLLPEERQTLTDAVERFRKVVRDVPPDEPATEQQIEQALPQFLRILEILRPDRYADGDAFIIGKRVEQALGDRFPPTISELRFETGEDHTGDPAVFILVILKDAAATEDVFSANVRTIRALLQGTVRELGFERWPYVNFMTDSELAELQETSKK